MGGTLALVVRNPAYGDVDGPVPPDGPVVGLEEREERVRNCGVCFVVLLGRVQRETSKEAVLRGVLVLAVSRCARV